ncbi:ATP-binding cassette domain-containing protein [Kitasatospora sp. NPDC051853]|uniref:ATP-binding cassette domain-containing protein n=1 Tax=Kitasatospora sp. NPDC051853 TaxID=3364058 RepID=UPI0037AD4B46
MTTTAVPSTATATAATRPAMALLRTALTGSARELAALAGWTVLSAAPAALSGKALALAVDDGFLAHHPGRAAAWLGLFAAAALLSAWSTRRAYGPLARTVEPARDRLLATASAGLLRRATTARGHSEGAAAVAVAQVTRQVEAVRDSLAGQLLLVSHLLLTVAAVLVGTAALAPAAVLPVALPLLLALAAFAVLTPRMARRQRELFVTEEQLAGSTLDATTALRDLVACGAEQQAVERVLADIAANEAAGRGLARLAAVRHLLVALGVHGPLALLVLTAPALLRHGLTTGALLGALAYLLGTLEPALRLLMQGLGPSWLRMSVAAGRLAATASPANSPTPQVTSSPIPDSPALELRGAAFSYGVSAEPVFTALDLTLRDGESLAVVGPSGIGKSTLAAVAAGILAPDRGEVLLSGRPAGILPPEEQAALRTLLPQDPYVFTGTLRANLCWPGPDRPTTELADALRTLGAGQLTSRHGGLDAEVTAGSLSPGERQLVAVTRAFLSPARLLVLDEATSHLDATTALRVETALRRRPGALLTVTHHPSQAARADRVLHLDGTRRHRITGGAVRPTE